MSSSAVATKPKANASPQAVPVPLVLPATKIEHACSFMKQAGDPTRFQVLWILSQGERHVGGLCDLLGQTQPAVSHHLALLRVGGLIEPRRAGKSNFYSLTAKGAMLLKGVRKLIE